MNTMNKLNKAQLTKVLNANFQLAKKADKDLADSISYTAKQYKEDATKVTKKDLLDLLKDVAKTLGDAFITPEVTPVAEHLKKSSSKKDEAPEETTEEVKKPAPKKSAKKSNKKVLTSATSEKAVEMLVNFPEEISAGDEKYSRADDIKTMDDLYKALEAGEDIVFAFWWTKRHLKQFSYYQYVEQPKDFPDDLDLATCIYVSEERKICFNISLYTEAPYAILPEDLEADPNGIRYTNGMEFQIYRK